MVKNIPSPCCGSYDIYISSEDDGDSMWYRASCPKCGFTTKESYDNKSEAVYEYETLCIKTWIRNRNGLMDWMKNKPKNSDDAKKRQRIEQDVEPYIMGRR